MSSSENTKPEEDDNRDETPTGRGESTASSNPASGQKLPAPAQAAESGANVGDDAYKPKFSGVRSRHDTGVDGDAPEKVPPEQSGVGTQSETSATVLSAAAFAIEMAAASSFDALPVTEVGNEVKSFADISIPENRTEVSSKHLNPEFGYHAVSEPKDEPRKPPAQLPPPPKSVKQYQTNVPNPATSKVDSLISQSENLDSIWEVHDQVAAPTLEPPTGRATSNQKLTGTADGATTADNNKILFAPQGYGASSMSPLSPNQDSLSLPGENLQNLVEPTAARRNSGSFRPDHQLAKAEFYAAMQSPSVDESGVARKQRSAQIRSSLYWVVKEARLVTHGVFADYEPPRGRTYSEIAASGVHNRPRTTANNLPAAGQVDRNSSKPAAPHMVSQTRQPQSDFAPPGQPPSNTLGQVPPQSHRTLTPYSGSRDHSPHAVAHVDFNKAESPPDAQSGPKPAHRLLTQNSLEAVRNEAPPSKLRAVPHIAGSADYLVNKDESPTIRFPEDAWDLQSDSQSLKAPDLKSPTPPAPAVPAPAPVPVPTPAPTPPSHSLVPPQAISSAPVHPSAPVEPAAPADHRQAQGVIAEGRREQASTAERRREQASTAERPRDQSTTSERRIQELRTTDQHKTDQRKTDQRTTRDGMIKVPLVGFVKKDDLKRQAITFGSVVVLCAASAIIVFDTINSNRKQADNAVETQDVVSTETDGGTRSEVPTAVEKSSDTGATSDTSSDGTKSANSDQPSLEAELAKAFKLEQQLNYIDSMNTFDKVIERDKGSNPKSLHGRGRVLTKLQLYDRALDDLESADKLDPHNINILIDLAAVKYLLGDYTDSAKDYKQILEEHPKDADALYGRGISYAGMGKNQEAIADFEGVIKLKPRYDKAYRQMCTAYLALNQADKAESTITNAMKACGADADLYFSRALSRYQIGNKESALEDYNEAIRLSPDRKEYYNDRGFVQMDLGRLEEARKDFNRALEIDPKYKLASDNLRRLRKLEKAEKSGR